MTDKAVFYVEILMDLIFYAKNNIRSGSLKRSFEVTIEVKCYAFI